MNSSNIRIRNGFGSAQFEPFRSSRGYDMLARLPLVLWFALCGVEAARRMITDVSAAPMSGMTETLKLLAGLAGLGFILLFDWRAVSAPAAVDAGRRAASARNRNGWHLLHHRHGAAAAVDLTPAPP